MQALLDERVATLEERQDDTPSIAARAGRSSGVGDRAAGKGLKA
jgi:hypothetical protein